MAPTKGECEYAAQRVYWVIKELWHQELLLECDRANDITFHREQPKRVGNLQIINEESAVKESLSNDMAETQLGPTRVGYARPGVP